MSGNYSPPPPTSGFDTFIKFSQVDPDVAWHKLRAMVEGAELATAELS